MVLYPTCHARHTAARHDRPASAGTGRAGRMPDGHHPDGRVDLGGSVESRSPSPVIERLCRSIDGVVPVAGHLAYRTDGSRRSPTAP